MKTHKYKEIVDSIPFTGECTIEPVDDSYPIFSLCSLVVNDMDLMLVIDPRVVHEIEEKLLADFVWNS